MPVKKNGTNFQKIRSYFFLSLILSLFIAMIYIIRPFFYPLFWAAIMAVLFYPLFKLVERYIKYKGFSAFISVLLVIVVFVLPLLLIGTLVFRQSMSLYEKISQSGFMESVNSLPDRFSGTIFEPYANMVNQEWTKYAGNVAKNVSLFLFNSITAVTQNTITFLAMLIISFYSLFFFFKDGESFLNRIMHLSPLGDKYELMLYKSFTSTARATLKSTLIIGVIQGTLGGILFAITGVPGALIWGVIMVALSSIPAVGSFIIWLPAGIIQLALGNVWQGLTILLVGALFISTIDNIVRPMLIGKDTEMHPVLALVSTLGGILLFGISGFVIGPVIASLFLAVISIYDFYYKSQLDEN